MKKIVRLNEQDINRIVGECVRQTLNESEREFNGGMGTNNATDEDEYYDKLSTSVRWILDNLNGAKRYCDAGNINGCSSCLSDAIQQAKHFYKFLLLKHL